MKDKVPLKFVGMTVVGEYENLYSISSCCLLPFAHIGIVEIFVNHLLVLPFWHPQISFNIFAQFHYGEHSSTIEATQFSFNLNAGVF